MKKIKKFLLIFLAFFLIFKLASCDEENKESKDDTNIVEKTDITGISFEGKTVVYDGNDHSLEITGSLPEGVIVSYLNNNHVDVGEYTVTASFIDLTGKYNVPADMTATLIINKAVYDMSGVTFSDKTYVYDGTTKTLEIEGTLPEGVSVSYTTNKLKDIGELEVTASFTGDSTNYEEIPNMTAKLKIKNEGTYDNFTIYVMDEENVFITGVVDKNVTSINIPKKIGICNVIDIDKSAFSRCTILTSIEIPSTVTNIEENAFHNCDSLSNVYYNGTIEDWCNISFNGYESNPMYFAENFYILDENGSVEYNGNKYTLLTELEIPNTVSEIGAYQFCGFGKVTSIEILSTVTSIGEWAFVDWDSISNVYYNGTIEDWCNISFGNYYSNPMYYEENFYILDENGSIEHNGNKYTLLTEIEIPNTVSDIGKCQFRGFDIVTNLEIPSTIISMGDSAFYNCDSLSNVYYNGTIEDWCNISFGNYYSNPMYFAENFYILDENGSVEYNGNKYTLLTELEIPNTVSEIGAYQFCGFGKVTSIEIPSTVTSIGDYAFYECDSLSNVYYNGIIEDWCNISFDGYQSNPMYYHYTKYFYVLDEDGTVEHNGKKYTLLTEIEIPNTISEIGRYQFYGFKSVTSILLPSSVTGIGDKAFNLCSEVTSITIPSTVTIIGSDAFYNCINLSTVYYNGTIENWCNISFGNDYSNPLKFHDEEKFYILDENGVVEYNGNKYTLLTELVIPSTVTSIESGVFKEWANITSITIPSTVTRIEHDAFFRCTNLSTVYYNGTQEQWEMLKITFENATIIFI